MLSTRPTGRIGAQEPRIRLEPEGVAYTDGEDAASLLEDYWFELDPWQKTVIDCWMSRDSLGNLLVTTAGVSCPRQNGKNGIIEGFEAVLLLTDPNTHILHTAHQVKTSKRAFRRLEQFFTDERNPEICEKVKSIRRTNGEEAIYLTNGASIEYSARSRSAARGFDAISLVVYDEAQELTDEQVEALMATLSASPAGDRQLIYAGTPPPPGSPGEVFKRVREKAITSPSKRTAWHEWGVEDLPPDNSTFNDLVDAIYETNPAMGIRLDIGFTEEEFGTMSLDGFARERLGWWNKQGADVAVRRTDWEKLGGEERPEATRKAVAVKFSADGTSVAVAGGLKTEGGTYVECINVRPMSEGLTWLVEWIAERVDKYDKIIIDGQSGSLNLVNRLDERGVDMKNISLPRVSDVTAASSMFLTDISESTVKHFIQPALDESVLTAVKRPIGKMGGFGFSSPNGSELIESVVLANWAVKQIKEKRKLRIG